MVKQIKAILAAVDTEIAAIKAIVDVMPDAGAFTALIAAIATLDGIADDIKAAVDTEIGTIDTVVDANKATLEHATTGLANIKALVDTLQTAATAIKAVTDVLPDAGAFTAVIAAIATIDSEIATLDSEIGTIDTVVDANKVAVDANKATLEHITHGLPNLKALIDTLQTAATAIKAVTDVLPDAGAFTAVIAAIATIDSEIATLDSEIGTIDTVVDAIKVASDKLAGSEAAASFSYLDAGGEQTVFTITTSTRKKLHGIFLDLATLTQNTTIKVKHKIDGSTYRVIDTIEWLVTEEDGVYFNKSLAINQDLQVTMEEGANEGAARAIPYYYILEAME